MRKIGLIITAFLVLGLIWLLFIKADDYVVVLRAKTVPGVINQTVKMWSYTLENSEIKQGDNSMDMTQKIEVNDSSFVYQWRINMVNDSITEVRIGVSEQNTNPVVRLVNLFTETDFEKRIKNTLLEFNEKLKYHLKSFKVTIEGESEYPTTFCAYVPVEIFQLGKARGMMNNYSYISNFLLKNKIELNGRPFIEVTHWDRDNDQLQYNFCYPVIRPDTIPDHEEILFKELKGKKALKAIYNGNYIHSDRAWYHLSEYAIKNQIEIDYKPVEFFFNNPNMGGDALQWTAEVYLPLKD